MKKRFKYALVLMFVHLFVLLIDNLSSIIPYKLDQSTSEGLGVLFSMLAMPYESPLFFIGDHPYLRPFVGSDKGHFIFWYLFGALFYFCIGFIIGYARELPKQRK